MQHENTKFALVIVGLVSLTLLFYFLSRPDPDQLEKLSQEILRNLNQHPANAQHAYIVTALQVAWVDSYDRGLSRHLAEALTIALIVLLTAEVHTKRLLRQEILGQIDKLRNQAQEVTEKTWEGVGRRLLGSKISQEVDEVLKANTAKEESRYNITFEKIIEAEEQRWAVVATENWFTLRNLTGAADETFPLATNLIGFRHVENYPEFISVEVNGKAISLNSIVSPDRKSLHYDIKLPPSREAGTTVKIAYRGVYRLADQEVFITSRVPIEQLNVSVHNQVPQEIGGLEVQVMHPHFDSLKRTSAISWRFDRALLPGQGFSLIWKEIRWEQRGKPTSREESAEGES